MNIRKEILDLLIPYFREDKRYFLLYGDMGFSALDKILQEFPDRCLNAGIAEQSMVGIAAGMAMNAMIPIVYTMPNFLVYRALEQIRNDVVLQNQNVKFIATGCNDYFAFLGKSHTCGEQDKEICKLIGLRVWDTFRQDEVPVMHQAKYTKKMVDMFMLDTQAGYLRV